jgi:hypothetical protein
MVGDSYEGGCGCGDVRYQMTSKPMFVHCCHCRSCQNQTGSAFAINALIEADRVQLLGGAVEKIVMATKSGKGQNIYRCRKCRVALWSNYLAMPGGIGEEVHFLRVGALDEPDRVQPDIHIYTRSKQAWLAIPENVVSVDGFYDFNKVWPKESLKRRAALLSAK